MGFQGGNTPLAGSRAPRSRVQGPLAGVELYPIGFKIVTAWWSLPGSLDPYFEIIFLVIQSLVHEFTFKNCIVLILNI
ncbi:hypothetical protein HanIR_Chr08g0359371 [Helianthus annuus]|nr:hypothetical protein HanIR_Chr08g0359371 [Helianthus annuus]